MRSNISADSLNNLLCCGFKRTHGMEKQQKYVVVAVETAEPPLVPGLESLRSQHFFHFETRNVIYKQLLEALERNYMTELHGIQGIGKTTLAKQVCLKLHDSIKFDHVIFITVSECSDIKEIQDIIAAKLGLSLKDNNEWERTETIMKRLMNGERIVLILDDVREYISTEEIGIPSRPNNMNCRVLMTSRDKQLCMSIGCLRSIQVDKLSMKEAWMSFKKHVGISDNSSQEMQDLGKQISDTCEGLPVIMAIASILKGQSLEEWKQTLDYLRITRNCYYDECWIKAYAFLNFSHDDLNIEKARRLFILLSLFPRNTEVPTEMLTRLATGLGLFGEVEKYSKLRSEVLQLKDILIDSHVCFEDDGGHIKMNDPICHMIQRGDLSWCRHSSNNKWVFSKIEKNVHYIYYDDLWVEEVELAPFPSWRGYDGTKVEMLLINVEANNSLEVPDAFFEERGRVQVLLLSSNNLHPILTLKLPSSLQSLTKIRSLLLSHWKLRDISILGKLQSLDTLDFYDCSIYEFPKEISTLKLRLLSLKTCQIKTNNPFKVIERCLSLQELYYKDNEVSTLDSVNEDEEIYQCETFPTLKRYNLQGVEDDSISKCVCLSSIDALVSEETFKYLIQGAEILHLKEIRGEWRNLIPEIVSSMNDVVELSLESCSKVECLINTEHSKSHVESAFSRLVELKLARMDNLKQLCSYTFPFDILESLKRLSIEHCAHLQGILFKSKVNLYNLKSVTLFDCQQLTSLFQLSTALSLVLLEEFRIRECKLLTCIIEDENDHKSNGLVFPKLETLEIEGCERLECILPIAFPRDVMLLQNIKISKCPKLKDIFYEEHGDVKISRLQKVELSDMSHLFNISIECYPLLASRVKRSSPRFDFKAKQQDPDKILISQGLNMPIVCNIKQLVLKDLHKIKYLFTLSSASSMMLEILIVDSCHVLKHIIDIGDGCDGKNFDVFLKLKELSVSSCGQLECMFGEYPLDDKNYNEINIHLPALKKLTLQELPKFSPSSMTWTFLKEFVLVKCPDFTINPISDMMIHFDSRKLVSTTIEDIRKIDKHFLTLETLHIKGYEAESVFCVRGVEIIGQVRLGLQCLKLINLPRMLSICVGSRSSFFFQNLKTIQIVECANLEVIFPASVLSYLPELEVLEIKHCYRLEQIIEEDKNLGNVDSPHPCFPKLAVLLVESCYNLKRLMPVFDVPNVKTIKIKLCTIIEVIFPASVLSYLPELEVLEIQDCSRLKQIIEEDKKLGNVDSPQPCFPKLAVLVVELCYLLKRLIPAFDVPNVKTIRIKSCFQLEVIFPDSVLSCLPELMRLEIINCLYLRKILEEDKNSPWPCFPKLVVLFVIDCYYCLKHLFSASNDVPNLELLIILNVGQLEELIGGGEQRQGDDVSIGNMKVELPKLKHVVFAYLPEATFKEGIELQTVHNRFVYECPKLSLKATATFKEMEEKVHELFNIDLKIHLLKLQYDHMAEVDVIVQSDVAQTMSGSDLPSSQSEFELSKSQTYTDKENEGHPTNIQDFKDNDRISSSKPVEEDGDGQIPTPSMSVITVEHSATNGNSERKESHDLEDGRSMSESCLINQQKPLGEAEIPQSKIRLKQILADLKESLKMPLKDIASSETNSLHLLMNLNIFLSHLPLEDVALFEGLKAIIDSLSQESPSILCSFKQAFATINKLAILEPHMNEMATMVASKNSKSKTFTGEARQKEATLKEKFFRLEKATTDLPIGLGAQTMSRNDLPSSQVSINQSIQANLAGYNHNDNGIKLDDSCIASQSPNLAEINEEPEKDLVGKVLDSEIPVTATTSPLDNTLHKTHLHVMVDGQSMSESCLMNQQKPIGETESTIEIPQSIERGVEEGTRSDNAKMVASATHSESANSQSYPHREIRHNQIEISGDEDSEALPINIQDSWDNMVKVLTDLKESLKMSLKDIACTEGNSRRLLTALKFLSNSTLEDATLSDGLKAIIVSMHKEPESILCSFKIVFATVKKIVVLQPYLNKVATTLVSKVSMPMDDAQQKEATMKEQISGLQNETIQIKDCEAKLSSLQEEKKIKFGTATTMRNSLNRLVAAADEAGKEEIEATSHVYGKYSIPECIDVLKSLKTKEYLNGQQFSYAL